MKLLILILTLLSTNAFACGNGRGIDRSEISSDPVMMVVNPPKFGLGFHTDAPIAKLSVVADLSVEGILENIEIVKMEPKDLPRQPLIDALKESRFRPKIKEGKAVRAINYEFEWEFGIVSWPKIELVIPQI